MLATSVPFVPATAAQELGKPIPVVAEPLSGSDVVVARANDFVVKLSSATGDISKFITYGWLGWTPNVVHWLYNDANRNTVLAPTSAAAVASIQTAMNKWTAACNIQFVYDGLTSTGASLAGPTLNGGGPTDGLNVIAWGNGGPVTGSTTGVTYVSASSSGGPFTLDESDVVLNFANNSSFDVTLIHEVGHMLGLDHSNVVNTVMSGPPTTPYVALTTLQADDIAGCRNLYGAPAPRTISGAITNGAGVANVTFCAQPAAGVTCTASNGAGAYSCTVPNGWTGMLHSPSVAGNRIPAQSFTAVSGNITRNITALSGIPGCNLDVDNNGLFEPATDGVAILRRLLGFNSSAFSGLAGTCAANTSASAIFNATTSNYNVTGGALTLPTTDGLVILRAMLGLTGSAVTNSLGLTRESGATNTTWASIQPWLNSNCGSSFSP